MNKNFYQLFSDEYVQYHSSDYDITEFALRIMAASGKPITLDRIYLGCYSLNIDESFAFGCLDSGVV